MLVPWFAVVGFAVASATLTASPNPKYSFEQCLVTKSVLGYGTCLGIGALAQLQSIDNDPEFDVVDGVSFIRDEQQQPRDTSYFLERDPSDFRMIVDSIGHVMSSRTMRWDMSSFYPGLVMKVTPSVDGVLEFVMEPHRENVELKSLKDLGTIRFLARQVVIPFLLGFKWKVATLIPIFFSVFALIAKKALLISKLSLVVSLAVAIAAIVFRLTGPTKFGYGGYGHSFYPNHHHGQPGLHNYHGYKVTPTYEQYDYGDYLLKGAPSATSNDYQDPINFRQVLKFQSEYERSERTVKKGRNFAWNENEKKNKP